MVKMIVFNYRKAGVSPEAFADMWLNGHGAMVKKYAHVLRIKKYVQSHFLPNADDPILSEHGGAPGCDSITEVWYDSIEDMNAGITSLEGQKANAELAADAARFCDMERMEAKICREETIFDFTAGG
ncbi:MAG: EthD domain-containing protein [Porticoccaceae bacterium]|jgi:uncharacterized protein (TIGR02118 family)|nr:EthD domain-containing protein [Porticoccaceae bacterium]